jgi:hypothetical protein
LKLKVTAEPVGLLLPIAVNVIPAPPFTVAGVPTKLFSVGALAVAAATRTVALPVALGNTPFKTVTAKTSEPVLAGLKVAVTVALAGLGAHTPQDIIIPAGGVHAKDIGVPCGLVAETVRVTVVSLPTKVLAGVAVTELITGGFGTGGPATTATAPTARAAGHRVEW